MGNHSCLLRVLGLVCVAESQSWAVPSDMALGATAIAASIRLLLPV